jgi:hypothetical protein
MNRSVNGDNDDGSFHEEDEEVGSEDARASRRDDDPIGKKETATVIRLRSTTLQNKPQREYRRGSSSGLVGKLFPKLSSSYREGKRTYECK